ncbi:MAG: hypothetical protein OEV92_10875 [Nitrospinota bacterium]|nr:hypothetical protein [Nitrospinota bacterium]
MAVSAGFLALGAIFTWPLSIYFLSAITYGYDANPAYYTAPMYEGDHLQYYYHLGLLKYAVLGKIPWFTNPLEFATIYRPDWLFMYSLPLSAALYLPFTLVSLPFAYNMFLMVAMVLSGLCMYLWTRELTGNRAAAFCAGVVFDFFPLRMVEILGGHPSGFIMFLVPLALYFFDRAIRRKSPFDGFFCGMAACVLAVQYNFFAYFLFMFLMAYIPWRVAAQGAREVRALIPAFIPMGAWFLAGIGWMYYFKKTMVEKSAMGHGRSWGEVENFSPPLWAAWNTSRGFEVYLGLAAIFALATLALLLLGKLADKKIRRDAIFFLLVFAGTYILAFGTSLNDSFPLYKLFYEYFPYFNLSRSPTKIMVIVILCLSALTAITMVWLLTLEKRRAAALGGLFMLALLYDYHPGKPVGICLLDRDNPAYRFIAESGVKKPVLNLPIWPGESSWESIYQYYAIESGTPMINGYSPLVKEDYINHVFWPLAPMNGGDMAQEQLETVKALNVGFVVFHADAYPPKVGAFSPYFVLKRLTESPYLELALKKDPLWVFKLKPSPGPWQPPGPSRLGSLFEAERLNWIGGQQAQDKDASKGWALRASPENKLEENGIINAGPYATFPAGEYQVTARIKVEGDLSGDGPVAALDVSGDQGRVILAQRDIMPADINAAGQYQDFELKYTLTPGKFWQVEYRLYLKGKATVWFDYAYVTAFGAQGPEDLFEAEDLRYYSGRLVEDQDATGGQAIRSMPGVNPADVMVFGPDTMFEPGRWRAIFRLKTERDAGYDALANIEARIGYQEEVVASRSVYTEQLGGAGVWGYASIDFTLSRKSTVDVSVQFTGAAPLLVDNVRLEKLPEPEKL